MKKLFKLSLVLATVLVLGYSCKTAQAGSKQTSVTDISGSWILQSLNGQEASTLFKGKIPALNIDVAEKRASGNGGCNNFTGAFVYEKGLFSIPKAATTMMACMDDNQEPQFLLALSKPSQLSIDNGVLKLTQAGTVVAQFVRGIDADALSGTWLLKSINGSNIKSVFSSSVPSLEFRTDENKLGGNGGCNRYNAAYTLVGSSLKVGPIMSTRMACEDLAGETQFTNALSETSTIKVSAKQLTFEKEGKIVLVFDKK